MKIFKQLSDRANRTPKQATTTTTTTEKAIPLSSLEAYKILYKENCDSNLTYFLFYFNRLVDMKNSQLVDLTNADGKVMDNQKFVDDLNATALRVITAIEEESPYPTLFGDVVKLQNKFQVVLRYYQEQCEQGQPIAQTFLHSLKLKNAMRAALVKQDLISPEHSETLVKYVINSTAESNMQDQMPEISKFITTSFLADHSKEANFSYSRPR